MADAETRIRKALAADTPGGRLDAVMSAYWATSADNQDSFVLVLAGKLTLHQPEPAEAR